MPRRPEEGITEDRYRVRGQLPERFDSSTFTRLEGKKAIKRGYLTDPEDIRLAKKPGAEVVVGRRIDQKYTGPRGGSPYTAQSVRVPVSEKERKRREKAAKEKQKQRRKMSKKKKKEIARKKKEEQARIKAAREKAEREAKERKKELERRRKAEEERMKSEQKRKKEAEKAKKRKK